MALGRDIPGTCSLEVAPELVGSVAQFPGASPPSLPHHFRRLSGEQPVMSALTHVDQFLNIVIRSKVVSRQQLASWLRRFREPCATLDQLTCRLITMPARQAWFIVTSGLPT